MFVLILTDYDGVPIGNPEWFDTESAAEFAGDCIIARHGVAKHYKIVEVFDNDD